MIAAIVAPASGTRSKSATRTPSVTAYGMPVANRTTVEIGPAMTLISISR